MGYGQNAILGISFQNSYGQVGDVGSAHYIEILSESLQKKIEPLISQSMRGIIDENDSYEGPHMTEGEIEIEADPINIGVLLKGIFNHTPAPTGSGSTAHIFSPRGSDWDEKSAGLPFTAHTDRDIGDSLTYQDLIGTTLELGIANGEFLTAKLGVIGSGVQGSGSALTASYVEANRLPWDVNSVTIGGASVEELRELTITVDETAEVMHTLDGKKTANRIKRSGFRTVSLSGTALFDNRDEYDQFISQSERELILRASTGVTVGATDEKIQVTLPLMRYEDFQGNADGPGQIEASFTARGKYQADSYGGLSIRILLTNTMADY